MAKCNKDDDYLTQYREFFEDFARTVEPSDQLPVKLGSYKYINTEVIGAIVDWSLQYLNRKSCPTPLIALLVKFTVIETRNACKKNPVVCGFNPSINAYEPLKLMQTVISKINEICLRYLDNSQLDSLPAPSTLTSPLLSICSMKNTRRTMEDRHVVIDDINTMFNTQDTSPASYYAVFDGHNGQEAAAYCAAHLHQFLVESSFYLTDPERALTDAFLRADQFFIEKSKIEKFHSGTTALCALLKPKEETLYVAWVGDSQALLVNQGKVLQLVKPHKPNRKDERERIEASGGCVLYWGTWRVNGSLAVSRAIGDIDMKPCVTAEPEQTAIQLDGNEEFLIMACDGLWDFVSEDKAALSVYKDIKENPEKHECIAEHLVELAKQEGSRDNISVIVIFLKEPSQIAKKLSGWPAKTGAAMDEEHHHAVTTTDDINLFHNNDDENAAEMMNKRNGGGEEKDDAAPDLFIPITDSSSPISNKPTPICRFDEDNEEDRDDDDEDFGPETDVDAVDDMILSPPLTPLAIIPNNLQLGGDVDDNRQVKNESDDNQQEKIESNFEPTLVDDNVVESGDDSPDEWNYFKVDPNKIDSHSVTLAKDTEVCTTTEHHLQQSDTLNKSDEMSQLNPDAKEFVPVTPPGSVLSPIKVDLMEDPFISQSPRCAIPMEEIQVPSANEFECEVQQRPSNIMPHVDDTFPVDQQQLINPAPSSSMQKVLFEKSLDDLEFHPKEKDLSGIVPLFEATCLEEKEEETLLKFPQKDQDPMSMSFYEDENDKNTEYSTNPFDLNTVQLLPDQLDTTETDHCDDDNGETPVNQHVYDTETLIEATLDNIQNDARELFGGHPKCERNDDEEEVMDPNEDEFSLIIEQRDLMDRILANAKDKQQKSTTVVQEVDVPSPVVEPDVPIAIDEPIAVVEEPTEVKQEVTDISAPSVHSTIEVEATEPALEESTDIVQVPTSTCELEPEVQVTDDKVMNITAGSITDPEILSYLETMLPIVTVPLSPIKSERIKSIASPIEKFVDIIPCSKTPISKLDTKNVTTRRPMPTKTSITNATKSAAFVRKTAATGTTTAPKCKLGQIKGVVKVGPAPRVTALAPKLPPPKPKSANKTTTDTKAPPVTTTNGDTKTTKVPITKRTISTTATATRSALTTTCTSSSTRTTSKITTSTNPITVKQTMTSAKRERPASTTTLTTTTPKPRPNNTLTAKSSAILPAATTKTMPTKTNAPLTTTTAKPRPISMAAAHTKSSMSRIAMTHIKPAPKSADSEKQKKDTANKQLSASRSAAPITKKPPPTNKSQKNTTARVPPGPLATANNKKNSTNAIKKRIVVVDDTKQNGDTEKVTTPETELPDKDQSAQIIDNNSAAPLIVDASSSPPPPPPPVTKAD